MGLAIRPGHARWAYSSFARFRERVAKLEGLDLYAMKGFTSKGQSWQTSTGNDITVLAPLLNHSDCDGYLDSYECEQMLPRLRAIKAQWDAEADPEDWDREQLGYLIESLEHSSEHGCAVVFS